MIQRSGQPTPVRRAARALRFAGHAGRGMRRLAVDAALGGRRGFPRTIGDLTPESLSAIIGSPVSAVTVLDDAAGTSTRARLGLNGSEVADSVFVKMSAAAVGIRLLGELAGLGETEANFYRHLAPELRGGVPRCHGAAFDAPTGRYVVVLEDMTTSPCQFPDTLHPLDADQMARLMECFAGLHATFWGRLPERPSGSPRFEWLMPGSADPANPIIPSVMRLSARRLATHTPIPAAGRFLAQHFQAISEVVDAGEHTVLHGDAHPGNTFFRDGRAGLLDWQVVRRGHPARDLSYAMVLGMATDARRVSERELLDGYRRALAAAGGPDLNRDDLFTRYRQAVVQPYIAGLTTAGLGGMQNEDIALEGLRRAAAALDDLDTVAALRRAGVSSR